MSLLIHSQPDNLVLARQGKPHHSTPNTLHPRQGIDHHAIVCEDISLRLSPISGKHTGHEAVQSQADKASQHAGKDQSGIMCRFSCPCRVRQRWRDVRLWWTKTRLPWRIELFWVLLRLSFGPTRTPSLEISRPGSRSIKAVRLYADIPGGRSTGRRRYHLVDVSVQYGIPHRIMHLARC